MEKIRREEVAEVLRAALLSGRAEFAFIKKDGTLRRAVGTLDPEEIPDADTPSGDGGRPAREDQTAYYDVEKHGWRCCKHENIVEVCGKEVV